jgi:outer membrane receptor protein involved in Fe transport
MVGPAPDPTAYRVSPVALIALARFHVPRRTARVVACSLLLATVTTPTAAQSGAPGATGRSDTTATADSTRTRLGAVTVAANRTRTPLGTMPTVATVLTRTQVQRSPANTVAGLLRAVPGMVPSNYQHPLIQRPIYSAVAFRGLGTTSQSRALVLLDGMPINDPFNAYVRWGRLPLPLVERIEVIRGGSGSAWGSRALGGVINIVTAAPGVARLESTLEAGEHQLTRAGVSGGVRLGNLGVLLAGDRLETGGFVGVQPSGGIDRPIGTTQGTGFAKLTYQATPTLAVHGGLNLLDERIVSGTPTSWRTASVREGRTGVTWQAPNGGRLELQAATTSQRVGSFETNIATDRRTETALRVTRVPFRAQALNTTWSQGVGARQDVTIGMDASWTDGSYGEDYVPVNGVMTRSRQSGSAQTVAGVFLQDGIRFGERTRAQLGVRGDLVMNGNGWRIDRRITTRELLLDTTYAGARQTAFTFNAGLWHQWRPSMAFRGAVYRGFRSPVPFELYSPISASNGATLFFLAANPALRPEYLLGAEGGVDLRLGKAAEMRVTLFESRATDLIVQQTVGIAAAAGQVIAPCGALAAGTRCERRANVSALRSRGAEVELVWRLASWATLTGGYTLNPTRVLAPGLPSDGKVAKNAVRSTGQAALTLAHPRVAELRVEMRWVGERFDDDLNGVRLAPFSAVDLYAARRLTSRLSSFVRIENAANRLIVGRVLPTGAVEIGGPRWTSVGIRSAWR